MHRYSRSQNPEPRSQNPEARTQKPEPRSQNPEARTQKPEARTQKDITGTWLFEPLKKVLTFMATSIVLPSFLG
jgi:hypothetical protein